MPKRLAYSGARSFGLLRFPIPYQFVQQPGKLIFHPHSSGKLIASNAQNIITQRWIAA